MSDHTIPIGGQGKLLGSFKQDAVSAMPLPAMNEVKIPSLGAKEYINNGVSKANAQRAHIYNPDKTILKSNEKNIVKDSYEGQVFALKETLQFIESAYKKIGFNINVSNVDFEIEDEKELLIHQIDNMLDQYAEQLSIKDSRAPMFEDSEILARAQNQYHQLGDIKNKDIAVCMLTAKTDILAEYLQAQSKLDFHGFDKGLGIGFCWAKTVDIVSDIANLHYGMQILNACSGLAPRKASKVNPVKANIIISKPNDDYKAVLDILNKISEKDMEQRLESKQKTKDFNGTIINLGRMPENIEVDDTRFNVANMVINGKRSPDYSPANEKKYKAISREHLQLKLSPDGSISVKNQSAIREGVTVDKRTHIYKDGKLQNLSSEKGFEALSVKSKIVIGKTSRIEGSGMVIELLERGSVENYAVARIGKQTIINFQGHLISAKSKKPKILFPKKDQIYVDGKLYAVSGKRLIEVSEEMSKFKNNKVRVGKKVYIQLPGKSVTLTDDYDQYVKMFGAEGPEGIELKQRNTGDCYLLAAIFALAQTPEGQYKLAQSMKVDESGNYEIIYDKIQYDSVGNPIGFTEVASKEKDARPYRRDLIQISKDVDLDREYQTFFGVDGVQKYSPVEGPRWARVAERAHGRVLELEEGVLFGETLYQLDKGGSAREAFAHLVGEKSYESVNAITLSSNDKNRGTDFYNFKRLVTRISKQPENFCLMASTTKTSGQPKLIDIGDDRGVVNGNHAYAAALKIKENSKGEEKVFITVYNPHNTSTKEKEGLLGAEKYKSFDMTIEEFYTYFNRFYVYDMRDFRKAIIADAKAKETQEIHIA